MLSRGEKVLPCLLGVSPRSISPAEGGGGGGGGELFCGQDKFRHLGNATAA